MLQWRIDEICRGKSRTTTDNIDDILALLEMEVELSTSRINDIISSNPKKYGVPEVMELIDMGESKLASFPSKSHFLFPGLLDQILHMVESLTDTCIICGKLFGLGMTRPATCEDPKCVMAFQDMGIGDSVLQMIMEEWEVFDLLVNLSKIASKSPRFTPDPYKIVEGVPDAETFWKFLESIPEKNVLTAMAVAGKLKEKLPKELYSLLVWIVASNRTELRFVEDKKAEIYKETGAKRVWHIRIARPEMELDFRERKEAHGSFFAYHGTNCLFLHSILRTGLRNLSGTQWQSNGAALGKGIYCSTNRSVSQGYSRNNFGKTNFGTMVLYCEIIDDKTTYNKHTQLSAVVITEEKNVSVRYILEY